MIKKIEWKCLSVSAWQVFTEKYERRFGKGTEEFNLKKSKHFDTKLFSPNKVLVTVNFGPKRWVKKGKEFDSLGLSVVFVGVWGGQLQSFRLYIK